jgi:hypothetical protein
MGLIRCLECGEFLESKHRHDFVRCKCPNETFIDGGNEYMRCGGKDLSKVQVIRSDVELMDQTRAKEE